MLATRPSSEEAAASSTASQEEKSVPGVSRGALRDERKPLLDLDDVEQLENELAACFDAPPPPPLNIRRGEPVATTVESWMPTSEPRYSETYVPPPTASDVAAAEARGELPRPQQQQRQRQQQQQQGQQATRLSDFSSLYAAAPHRAESTGQLYPTLVPSAPSSEALRIPPMPHSAAMATAPAATTAAPIAAAVPSWAQGEAAPSAASSSPSASAAASGVEAARAASESVGGDTSSSEVVDELLAENERLRLIIQEMSEELERGSAQAGGVATAAPAASRAQAQAQRPAAAPARAPAASSQRSMDIFPGAQAEAARRFREQHGVEQPQQQQQQQQQQQENQGQTQQQTLQSLRPVMFVHFKCENCPQWLKVPGHAQLVYCPLCGHTSQMTASSTIYVPPNNAASDNRARGAAAGAGGTGRAAAAGRGQEEEAGWFSYLKNILSA